MILFLEMLALRTRGSTRFSAVVEMRKTDRWAPVINPCHAVREARRSEDVAFVLSLIPNFRMRSHTHFAIVSGHNRK
jgi:hypothetical protein